MRSTPLLPPWIREKAIRGYINAYSLCPNETRLYGTESLYGDWDAPVLRLAKDFAPSRYLHEQIAAGTERPYSHDPALRTNRRLRELVQEFLPVPVLYGSALSNLLRDDGRWSGALPNRSGALRYGVRVLSEFVLPILGGRTWITCLGEEAWECACAATRQVGDWRTHRDTLRPLGKLLAAYQSGRSGELREAGEPLAPARGAGQGADLNAEVGCHWAVIAEPGDARLVVVMAGSRQEFAGGKDVIEPATRR